MDDKLILIQKMRNDSYLAVLKDEYRLDGSSVIEAKTMDELTEKLGQVERVDDRWVTMNGAHVLINGSGRIVGGAGGKFNGMRFGTVFKDYGNKAVQTKSAGKQKIVRQYNWADTERWHAPRQKTPAKLARMGQTQRNAKVKIARGKGVDARTGKRKGAVLQRRPAGEAKKEWLGYDIADKVHEHRINGKTYTSGTAALRDHKVGKRLSDRVQRRYDKMRRAEPKITKDILTIADGLGMQAIGLEYSVKTGSSVRTKLERKSRKMKNGKRVPDHVILDEMSDIVRHTLQGNHKNLVKDAVKVKKELESKGYKIVKVENKYLDKDSDYKGIHFDCISPSGVRHEMQIHSKESMLVKERLHPIYEKSRILPKGSAEQRALQKQMKAISAELAMPDDIASLPNFG